MKFRVVIPSIVWLVCIVCIILFAFVLQLQPTTLLAAPPSAAPALLPALPAADPAPPQFLRDLPELTGLIGVGDGWTVGGGFLYWGKCQPVDGTGGYLRRWPLRGGRAVTIQNSSFCGNMATWAADDSGLYYGDGASIVRRPAGNPFALETIAASTTPTSRIILNNGTALWRDYIFWLANNTLYSAHRYNHRQLARPEPLGANAHSLLFANNNYFYWFADGVLYRALKPCLGFGGGACSKEVVASENGDHVTDATLTEISLGYSTFPLWTSGTDIRGMWCRFTNTGYTCSPNRTYTAPAGNSLGTLTTDGQFLFWLENHQDCPPGRLCGWTDNGRLMKWSLRQSTFSPGVFDTPQQIACKQCFANYAIGGIPGDVEVADGWVYFDTSNGPSRIRADAPPLNADLAVDGMEVTQGIQNLNNDVPLVADRPSYVRLYARKLHGPNTYSVQAVLYGTGANGGSLSGSPLRPINGGQDFTANDVDPNRAAMPGSWLFQLPDSWVGLGTIALHPLLDPDHVWGDPDQQNNTFAPRPFAFSRRAPICIVTIPVRTRPSAASNSDPSLFHMADVVRRLMPTTDVWIYHQDTDVAQLEARFGIPPWKYEPYAVPEKGEDILKSLGQRETFSDDPDRCDDINAVTHYVGLINAATNTQGDSGVNLGLGRTPGSVLYIKLLDEATMSKTPLFGEQQVYGTLAHELSHNYGRQHVNCGKIRDLDLGFPYHDVNGTSCVLDDGRRGGDSIPANQRYYGFDTQSLTPIDPGDFADLMTYNSDQWVSDYTWRNLFAAISTPPLSASTSPELAAIAKAQAEMAAAAAVVYISGSVDPAANTGSLDYAWVYPSGAISQGIRAKLQRSAVPHAASAADPAAGAYTLRLRGAAGNLLDERAVTMQTTADGDGTVETFALTFPAPAVPVARLELMSGDAVIATLQQGGSAPVVSILSPTGGETIEEQMTLSWRASDPDAGDKLLFTVQYSPDSGLHWHTMLTAFPNRFSGDTVTLALDSLSGLPGSTTGGLIRVAASDGYNTTLATSPSFTVVPRAPAPHIDSPGRAPIPAGQPVIVRGGATDVQDGGLSGDALHWTLDGQDIGNGTQQTLAGLAPGSYALALTADNTQGKMATAATTFTVMPLVIPQGNAPTLDGTCDDAVYTTAPQLPLAPYPDGTQAFVRLLRSSDSLYACFIGMRRTGGTSPGTTAGVRVDTNHSRDTLPQPGDYLVVIGEDGVIQTFAGDGSSYITPGPGGVAGQVSATATTWMAEMQINAGVLGGWGHVIGLDVEQPWVAAVGDDYFWPYKAIWSNPATWATTALGEVAQTTALTPDSASVGSGDTTIRLDGSGFAPGAVAQWNGVALPTSVISSTQLEAVVGTSNLAAAATFDVTVVNPGLEAAPSSALPFAVLNPVPSLAQVSLMGTALTVTGGNFVDGAAVQWNGVTYPATFNSSTQLQVTLGSDELPTADGSQVTVYNPGPGGGVSNVVLFILGTSAPTDKKLYLPQVGR